MSEPMPGSKRAEDLAEKLGLRCVSFGGFVHEKKKTIETLRNLPTAGKDQHIPLKPDEQRRVLDEDGELNDELLTRALEFINKKHPLRRKDGTHWHKSEWKAAALHNTFSFMQMEGESNSKSRRRLKRKIGDLGWTKGESPQLDCLMIPCHHREPGHWTLALVFPKPELRTITILDSLEDPDRRSYVYKHIREWLYTNMALKDEWKKDDWPLELLPCPQQENSHDCGVHVALNAWFISQGIWPMAHGRVEPAARRSFLAYMLTKGPKDCNIGIE